MATPRSASPPLRSSPIREFLTPRSKLQALVATAGSDSEDDDATSPNPSKNHDTHVSKTADIATHSLSDSSSDDDEDVLRPRGRFAARMHRQVLNSDNEELPALGNARERVISLLQREAQPGNTDTAPQTTEDKPDDNLAPQPSRLFQKPAREETPEQDDHPADNSSPGLFVSPGPKSPTMLDQGDEDEDVDTVLSGLRKNHRFQALIEKKRREREAREAEEEERLAARRERVASFSESDSGGSSDAANDPMPTQGAIRPARKAGRKALEEMNKETQRMARNMQLAHEAKTRKKISKASLFEKFNFRPAGSEPTTKLQSSSRPTTPASEHASDDAAVQDSETPPSSPPIQEKEMTHIVEPDVEGTGVDRAFPALEEIPSRLTVPKDTPAQISDVEPKKQVRRVRVRLPPMQSNTVMVDLTEPEVKRGKKGRLDAIFDRVPQKRVQEPTSIVALRRLAQVTSPGKPRRKGEKDSMTAGELQVLLHKRAREQAKLEKERRLEVLRSKGIVVQTEEERRRQLEDVEDMVARARKEAEEIMEREREEAKKEREGGEQDPLAWDDSEDDGDYQEEIEEDEPADIELSGSESEGAADDEAEDDDDDDDDDRNPMFDEEAESDVSNDEADGELEANVLPARIPDPEGTDSEADLPRTAARRSKKHARVLSDDEDDQEADVIGSTPKSKAAPVFKSPATTNMDPPAAPTSVLRSAKKTFIPGLPVAGPAGISLTQMFAGTMDDSQVAPSGNRFIQSPMPTFDAFPESLISNVDMGEADEMVLDSQRDDTQLAATQNESAMTQGVQLHYSQSQMRNLDSLLRESDGATQMTEIQLTQDGGLEDRTPLRERFIDAPASTISTLVEDKDATQQIIPDSPLVRRGKLHRRIDPATTNESSTQFALEASAVDEFGFNTVDKASAFKVMQKAAKKQERRNAVDNYDKKNSKAKEMIEEQAQESEDEYAGLGGVDGEDSGAEESDAGSVQDMIDDDAKNNVDERKLAAFYADRERAEDEKQVEKLFKDVTTGMLRRKRGSGYDLSDSDDDGEARRRMKRRQFAKMQKALFADERIKKIAEAPGNQAFLRTIEDVASDDDMEMIDILPDSQSEVSQSQSDSVILDSQPAGDLAMNTSHKPNPRRTRDSRKPASMLEIRESLSSLLEEPGAHFAPVGGAESSDDDNDDAEDEEEPAQYNKENQIPAPIEARRGSAVIDRISLARSNTSQSSSSSTRMAFGPQKPPSLLRRATTNSILSTSGTSSASTSGASTPLHGGSSDGRIRKGATRTSGVNYFARENERRAKLAETEKRRNEKKVRGAEARAKLVGGLFGAGSFE